ncbi:DDB1- and CUL4-associated factor 10 homolog isoform X2 [Achroia grisella]|uniref:DDB1- and CUL4-associated factor 10 homolog isoform X2 n=1 Tax=Achroia grisella TaxID=688607 RepID=UPI0027D2F0C3|nr:DDB1- and CUL4-associated factor 10 homolog isoform X2 [Achroia grisella]
MTNAESMKFLAKNSAFSPYRLMRRETGFGTPIGAGDAMARSLYCGMKPIASWDCEQANAVPTGGVFNLEFSPEGTLLVAACEKKSIQIFDPLTHKRIHSVNSAHSDCVNCVKFLDGRMFATCSDDTTIALWDIRNMKKTIRSLCGHTSWVKNIEFSFKDKLLVTSELNGSIYTWDINSYTECNLVYQRVFHASGLMRCRLSPDARQMVMCTTGGLLVIIHNLNLSTLAQDLHGFKPNLYRLMQTSHQLIPIAALYDHLFDDKREENRIEFVSDFPDGNDAKVVSSLQIHPLGWSALSRNISHDDRSEWSCIHDIQASTETPDKSTRDCTRVRPPPPPRRPPPRRSLRRPRPRLARPLRPQNSVTPAGEAPGVGRNFNMQRIMGINTGISPPSALRPRALRGAVARLLPHAQHAQLASHAELSPVSLPSTSRDPSPADHGDSCDEDRETRHYIRQNRDRLLYYIEETNEGKGFIKELCYSADGRLVCSPFGRGMRLLALNENCSELSQCVQYVKTPKPMVDVGQSLGIHQDLVVSSKFNPRYHMLVTGCLEGKIVWYEPYSGESLY